MIAAIAKPTSEIAASLFDIRCMHSRLAQAFPKAVSGSHDHADLRLERYSLGCDGHAALEWSVRNSANSRVSIYGQTYHNNSALRPLIANGAMVDLDSFQLELPDVGLILHSPDRDPWLPELRACLDLQRMDLWFQRAGSIPTLVDLRHRTDSESLRGQCCECRLIAYRPGRRAVVAYNLRESNRKPKNVLVKLYRRPCAARMAHLHAVVNAQIGVMSRGQIRVPLPLCVDPERQLVAYPVACGSALAGPAALESGELSRLVRALTYLHRTWVSDLNAFTIASELSIIDRWQRWLLSAMPDRARGFARIAERLHDLAPSIHAGSARTLHRDFYAAQCLVTRRITTLLDLDTICRGDPGIDLGNLLAHLALDLLRDQGDLQTFLTTAESLIQAYEFLNGSAGRENIAFYCASAACRVGAVHAGRTSTGHLSGRLWEFAEQILLNPPWSSKL